MTINAVIIADSISPAGIRLTTLQLRYPKYIHGEFMTHRVFSRNASSSRAIPVERLIKDVMDDPAVPIHWGKNQKGMQAEAEHDAAVKLVRADWKIGEAWKREKHFTEIDLDREGAWLDARDRAVETAEAMHKAGYHKQVVNRLIEPFCHINVVVTSTEWSNFFALRCHKDAQPEMRLLAECMRHALHLSKPKTLGIDAWHVPYVTEDATGWDVLVKLSVARCARVSYLTQDGKEPNVGEDLALYDRLVAQVPLHASPAEHQATPDKWIGDQRHLHGNLRGWIQFRKTLPGECQ